LIDFAKYSAVFTSTEAPKILNQPIKGISKLKISPKLMYKIWINIGWGTSNNMSKNSSHNDLTMKTLNNHNSKFQAMKSYKRMNRKLSIKFMSK